MMKKFVLALIISLCLVLPFSVNASELEKSFETSFDYDIDSYVRFYIMVSYDNNGKIDGHIIFDDYNSFIEKFDLNNREIYMKKDVFPAELQYKWAGDGLTVNKINPDTNEVIWHIDYSRDEFNYVRKILYSYTDNKIDGYIFLMSVNPSNIDVNNGDYILKYDLDGKLIWKKRYRNSDYIRYSKSSFGDLIKYSIYRGEHGSLYIDVTNTTQNKNIFNENFYNQSEANLVLNGEDTIIFLSSEGFDGKYAKFLRFNKSGEKIVEKEILPTVHITSSIAYKNIISNYDGIFLGAYDSNSNNYVMGVDCDGNLIWKHLISYSAHNINESYDETGEFNGYIVTGYDKVNKKGYITKFTYPKKVIESKSSDVEVISDAYPGKTVTVKAKEKTGYVVKRIVVKDSSGKEIEVGSDGTFIMPDDDVSVEVIYEKKAENIITNPDTVSAIGAVLFLIMTIVSGTLMVKNNRKV